MSSEDGDARYSLVYCGRLMIPLRIVIGMQLRESTGRAIRTNERPQWHNRVVQPSGAVIWAQRWTRNDIPVDNVEAHDGNLRINS